MRPSADPAELSPDQRLSELAGILAVGIIRLTAQSNSPGSAAIKTTIPLEAGPQGLELSSTSRLTVTPR
jgi:hypothetical protein